MVNTIVLSFLTVTYSTMLPQSDSSNSVTASGSFSSSVMKRSNYRRRMPFCRISAATLSRSALVDSYLPTAASYAVLYSSWF